MPRPSRRHRTRAPLPRHAARGGFTLVELVVAIVVLSIGLLGLAGTAGVVTRQMGGGAQSTIAAGVATARIEMLRARSCASMTGGQAKTRGISEVWTVSATATARARLVSLTVRWPARDGEMSASYTSIVPCVG